jgi:hypothetical protein
MSCPKILWPRSTISIEQILREMDTMHEPQIPKAFRGIGYTRPRDGLPLEEIQVPVPRPAADQVLIHVACSSLNPLEYKLAELTRAAPITSTSTR